ncbi:MAG: hypothetical protein SPK87_08845 [Bacteroidales bacterium]|nr:hypothetical protein [Bacteroidales bacterium]
MKYKAIKIFGIAAMLLLPFQAGAQQAQSAEEEIKQMREAIDQTVENYERILELEDWQSFYVDSILTHDYDALRVELKSLQAAKMSNADVYQQVQDKWAEQIYVALQKVLDEKQWAKYLKNGAAREKKARDKRAAKRN